MSGQIFISYRREDSEWSAGRLGDCLSVHFGREKIFMDVDAIEPGVDFVEAIEQAVGACDVLIAVIGNRWLTSADAQGRRRLDVPEDSVRIEIGTALKRGIRVIPVRAEGALMPQSDDLPDDLKKLARRNAIEISHNRFRTDSERLIGAIKGVLERADAERKEREEKERLEIEQRQREEQERQEIEQRQREERERLEAEQRQREERERLEAEQCHREDALIQMPDHMPRAAVFVSYSRDDREAVETLVRGLAEAQIPVWVDRHRLRVGENYERSIELLVKITCSFFVSVISNATESDPSGFVHIERNWAAQRHVDGFVYYIPVVIDDTEEPKLEPASFAKIHFDRLPNGIVTPAFTDKLRKWVEDYRLIGRPRG
jgi:TIR domain